MFWYVFVLLSRIFWLGWKKRALAEPVAPMPPLFFVMVIVMYDVDARMKSTYPYVGYSAID